MEITFCSLVFDIGLPFIKSTLLKIWLLEKGLQINIGADNMSKELYFETTKSEVVFVGPLWTDLPGLADQALPVNPFTSKVPKIKLQDEIPNFIL